MNFLMTHVLGWAVAALPIGTITFAVGQLIKRASDTIDAQPAPLKVFVLVPAIAAGLTAVGAALHVPIVCPPDVNCLGALDTHTLSLVLQAVLAWVVALVTHSIKNGNPQA